MTRIVLPALAALATAVAFAAPAHADTNDDVFVATLDNMGIPYTGGHQNALRLGHAICQVMDENGYDVDTMNQAVANNEGLSGNAAAFVVGAAIKVFCPWDMKKIWQG
jgi:hypothetical protein